MVNGGIKYDEKFTEEYVDKAPTISTKSVDELLERLKPYLSDNVAIFGGHWIPDTSLAKKGFLSEPESMPTLSFEIGAKLYSYAIEKKYSNVNLCLLFGDIAFKKKRREELILDFPLPESYARILLDERINKDVVKVFSEKWLQDSANDFLMDLYQRSKDNHSEAFQIQEDTDGSQVCYYGGIAIGKIINDPDRKSIKSTCPLIQTAEMHMASELGATRVIDVRDHSSFLCNEKYALLYEMLDEWNPDMPRIEIVNASLLWNETLNTLGIKNRFWLNPKTTE